MPTFLIPTFQEQVCSFSMKNKAVVIGAGIGGIAAAIRLALKGYSVETYEAGSKPGGKLGNLRLGEYRFDTGPSLFTMPYLVDELFIAAGKEPSHFFQYQKLGTACHYFYPDGKIFKAPGHVDDFIEAASHTFGADKSRLTKYLAHCRRLFDDTGTIFLQKSLRDPNTWLSKDILPALKYLPKTSLFQSMNRSNEQWIQEPHLVQLFNRYATYNGSNPYKAPGILQQIAALEQGEGSFFPKGGMYSIISSLYELAKELGVNFHFNQKVHRIHLHGNKVVGVQLRDESINANLVVSNMDIVPTYRYLLPDVKAPFKTLSQERSSSAFILYLGISRMFKELDVHNIFFSEDYRKEFRSIFHEKLIPDDPTVYIHISSKLEPADAASKSENWFVMVNVPSGSTIDWNAVHDQLRAKILSKLSMMLGQDIEAFIEEEDSLNPQTIERNTFSYQGALYGPSSNNALSAFIRHPNYRKKINGLYFVGGSVHPGGGVPLSLLSAKIVDHYVLPV